MANVFIKIDSDRFKIGSLIEAEEGKTKGARDMIAACMTKTQDGEYLSFDEALAILNDLTMSQFTGVMHGFMQQMEAIRNNAIPPASSG